MANEEFYREIVAPKSVRLGAIKTADPRACPNCGTVNSDASQGPSGDTYVCSNCGNTYSSKVSSVDTIDSHTLDQTGPEFNDSHSVYPRSGD